MPIPDPLSVVSSSFNATIKILEVTYQLKAVDEQTADLLSTTRHVDFMVQEARRLRRLKTGLLNTSERTMIDKVISDTEDALRAVAKLVEPCRVDKTAKNGIRFGHRVMWVFRDNPSVRDKHQKLQVCHQSLTIVFACLYSKDVVVIAPAPEGKSEEQPPPYDPQLKELLDWRIQRKGRKGLGEREGPMEKSRGLTTESPSGTPVARAASPCLLAIPLDNDGGTSSILNHADMLSKSSALPTPESQASVLRNDNNRPFGPADASLGRNSLSPGTSAQDSSPLDGTRNIPSATHTNGRDDYISPMPDLPEIDSPPFATMIGAYNFNQHGEDSLQVNHENLPPMSFSARDQRGPSFNIAQNTAASVTSSSPTLPFSTVSTPTMLKFSTEYGLGFKLPELSQYTSPGPRASTEISDLGKHPLETQSHSDVPSYTTYQSESPNAISGREDIMTRENRATSVGQGIAKRGGRSWLAYHATRSDTGHTMDWDG